MIAELSN